MQVVDAENEISVGDKVDAALNVSGKHNTIRIGDATHISNIRIFVNGEYNSVVIGNSFQIRNLLISCGTHVPAHNTSISIGDNFSIEDGSRFLLYNSGNSLSIGNNCMFSNGITVRCGESPHLLFDLETGQYLDISEGVFIGDHVWIGENVYITKNATVPGESIVAACSVVTRRFSEEHCVLAGNPAQVVRRNAQWVRNRGLLQRGTKYWDSHQSYHSRFPKRPGGG